jgi:polysaccharide deacetylase family protein (PEP-CTERM system associated)
MLNAFTVDVEDYFQVSGFERHIHRDDWDGYESRVVPNTRRILRLLNHHHVKATFFVLGWVAERFPDLVLQIRDEGHEIGSHGYWHRLIYDQTPDEFREDLCRARDLLEGITGNRVLAYRAPSFSIIERSRWALDILAEEGFTIDSSIYPIHHDRYGMPDALPHLHRIETSAGPLWELPPSSVRAAGKNIPVGGGGYFRLYPLPLTRRWLTRINRTYKRPFMFYIHPWEADPEQPRLKAGSWLSRRRHYVNLSHTERKLTRLLAEFRFAPMQDVIEQQSSVDSCPLTVKNRPPAS